MTVKIRFIEGTNSIIEDAYHVSAKPDDFFVRVFHPEGTIIINRNKIGLMEVLDKDKDIDSDKENKNE